MCGFQVGSHQEPSCLLRLRPTGSAHARKHATMRLLPTDGGRWPAPPARRPEALKAQNAAPISCFEAQPIGFGPPTGVDLYIMLSAGGAAAPLLQASRAFLATVSAAQLPTSVLSWGYGQQVSIASTALRRLAPPAATAAAANLLCPRHRAGRTGDPLPARPIRARGDPRPATQCGCHRGGALPKLCHHY